MAYERYDIDNVSGIDELRERMENANSVRDWSFILKDHISIGNTKINKQTAIFNMASAHDCVNRESENCQVPWEDCYAGKAERTYGKDTLPYRRRQEYIWDCMNPELFAKAFQSLNSRKRNTFTSLRINESGDFRTNGDIVRLNQVAKILDVDVYTYSASNYLNWDLATDFTINASNDLEEYGDRRFMAVPEGAELPDDTVWCPYSLQQNNGVPEEDRHKCGDCKLCINEDGPNVAVELH
jgi:hypothetical protein